MKKFYLGFLKAPLFWSAVLFGTGIAYSAGHPRRIIYLIISVVLFSIALLLRSVQARKNNLRPSPILFLILLLGLASAGAYYFQARLPETSFPVLEKLDPDQQVWIRAEAKGMSRDYEKYSRVLSDLVWLDAGKGRNRASARFYLNYSDERKLYPGDRFLALVRVHPITTFKNPLLPDLAARFYKNGIFFNFSQVREMPILKIYSARPNPLAWLDRSRTSFKDQIIRSGASGSYLLLALVLGDESEIPEPVEESFRATGTAHILVVSGFNLSLVASFCSIVLIVFFRAQPWLIKRMDPYPLAGILSIIPTTFYAFITGLEIPVLRSYIMVLVLLLAITLRKTRDLLNALGLAGMVIMLIQPGAIFDPSFQLSFIAVAVLIRYFPPLWQIAGGKWFAEEAGLLKLETHFFRAYLKLIPLRLLEYIYGLFLGTTLIQIFVAPISAYYFSRLSLVGPIANIPIVPLCGFWVLPIALVGLCAGLFSPGLGDWLINLAGIGSKLMEQMVAFFAGLPHAYVLVRPPTPLELAGWFLILKAGAGLPKKIAAWKISPPKTAPERLWKFTRVGLLFLLGIGLVIAGGLPIRNSRPRPDEARVTLLDVGLGQSIVIDLPGRERILLDGAGQLGRINLGEAVVSRFLLNQGIRRLDAVILTHPQTDHGAGLKFILAQYPVSEFWLTGKENQLSQELLEIAARGKIKIRMIGSQTPPVRVGDATLEFLNPSPERVPTLPLNDSSIAIQMTYQGIHFLFPAEIGTAIEKQLVAKNSAELKSDLLVAGHHGSNTSSSPEFLKAVSPQWILISSGGASGQKFPSPAALQRLQKTGAAIFRTDLVGAIQVSVRNRKASVSAAAPAKNASRSE